MNDSQSETIDPRWSLLYRLGGLAAAIVVVVIPIQIIVFMTWPPPTTVEGIFKVFQSNKLIGLLDFDLLIMVDLVLGVATTLAIYVILRRVNESFMVIGLAFSFIATVCYFASNTSFSMLALSDQYAAATTDAQRTIILAAGQAMLAIYNGTAFHAQYVLGSIALIIISVVMLRSRVFSKATAYLGILANVIAFGLYVPNVGIYISIFSVVFLWAWNILVARKLLQLSKSVAA